MEKLVPDYLSIDYNTYLTRIINTLKKEDYFKDFDFEGSNIRLLLELFAYQNEINTYYLNKIAKNIYDDTVDIYENAHRISRLKGYSPRGYISSQVKAKLIIKQFTNEGSLNFDLGDQFYIPYGTKFFAKFNDPISNSFKTLTYILNKSINFQIPTNNTDVLEDLEYEIELDLIEGEPISYIYKGKDIIDGKLILPFQNFNHDLNDLQENSTMSLSVNNVYWQRVGNFYESITQIEELKQKPEVFAFRYDKFKRYLIEFNINKKIPDVLDEIKINLVKCNGITGNIGPKYLTLIEKNKVYNLSKGIYIDINYLSVTNDLSAYGGKNPENITDLVYGGKGTINSQERLVTKDDYTLFLKTNRNIISANVWGEKDISKKGNIEEYNKIHISLIPDQFRESTIESEMISWKTDFVEGFIEKPKKYNEDFIEDLKTFLEPRKIITTFEQFELPDLVYFAFHLGLKIQPYYNFVDISNQIQDKLNYYFLNINRKFGEKISFLELHNFLLDMNIMTENKSWDLIKGISNIVFRNIWISSEKINKEKIDFYALPPEGGEYFLNGEKFYTNKGYNIKILEGSNIYPPNKENDFPMYTKNEYIYQVENKMKVIKLGFNQFPVLANGFSIIEEEF